MNFQQLLYFKTVYECKNITKASEKLHISQPAVSTALRELESELGIPLFVRQNRGIIATEEGVVFYTMACRMLAQCENAKKVVKEVADQKQLVRIGMAPMSGNIVFPKIYERLSRECPKIELEILEDGSYELIKRLEEDQVELLIVPEGAEYQEFVHREIYRSSMVFAVNQAHPLAGQESLELRQFDDFPLAIYRQGYLLNRNVEQLFEEHGLNMKIVARTSSYVTLKTLIDCGACGGFLIREICDHDENIRCFEVPQLPDFSIHLVWKQDGYLSNAARQVIRCCRELI